MKYDTELFLEEELSKCIILLKAIEWSASCLNEDAEHVARMCPRCEGIHPDDAEEVAQCVIGHDEECDLTAMLARWEIDPVSRRIVR